GGQRDLARRLMWGHVAAELARDLGDLSRAALLGREQDEVADELVGVGEDLLERGSAVRAVDLGIGQERLELGHRHDRGDEVAEILPNLREAIPLEGGPEERGRVGWLPEG